MTTRTVTQREIGSKRLGPTCRSNVAAHAGARARITVTERIGKAWGLINFLVSHASLSVRQWWAWTSRPLSLRALWRLSAVDPARVPAGSTKWTRAWRVSNGTDRLLMFALVLVAPTGLTGPLRWIAVRPTRRLAFYVLTTLFVAYLLI